MKLNNGLTVKDEYFEAILSCVEGEQVDAEDAIEFVYSKYSETFDIFKTSDRFCCFTKGMFINAFIRLFEDIGHEVFELSTSTFVKCVSKNIDDKEHHFTKNEIDEMALDSVWSVFSRYA